MDIKDAAKQYVNSFFGYGSFNGPYWFVGKEEGGGGSVEDIHRRIETWAMRGMQPLEDLVNYHFALNLLDHVGEKPRLQATWKQLIRVVLTAEGASPEKEAIRKYQRTLLGRTGGKSCLIELLPLPAPSTNVLPCLKDLGLPEFRHRNDYRDYFVEFRIARINQLISTYRPKHVVFYGKTHPYPLYWKRIAATNFELLDRDVEYGERMGINFYIIPHATAHGLTNEYFDGIGRLLRSRN